MSDGIPDQHGQPHNQETTLKGRNYMPGLIEQLNRVHILDDIPEVIDFGGLEAAHHSFIIGSTTVVLAFAIAAGVAIYLDPAIHQSSPSSTHVEVKPAGCCLTDSIKGEKSHSKHFAF